ncbi:MAG: coxX [Burkholderiales bacterium]|jgi:uncharacterized membrane protein|nr:coxX [Burkholderiales bacterium]
MHALWIASGIAVWALHFSVVYGFTALACARGFAHAIPWVVTLVSLAAVALAAAIIVKGYRERSAFIEWMTAGVAGLALLAIVYETTAGLLSPQCG